MASQSDSGSVQPSRKTSTPQLLKCTEIWASMRPQVTLINLNMKILAKI